MLSFKTSSEKSSEKISSGKATYIAIYSKNKTFIFFSFKELSSIFNDFKKLPSIGFSSISAIPKLLFNDMKDKIELLNQTSKKSNKLHFISSCKFFNCCYFYFYFITNNIDQERGTCRPARQIRLARCFNAVRVWLGRSISIP